MPAAGKKYRFCYVKCSNCGREAEAFTGKPKGAVMDTPCPVCREKQLIAGIDVPKYRRGGHPPRSE